MGLDLWLHTAGKVSTSFLEVAKPHQEPSLLNPLKCFGDNAVSDAALSVKRAIAFCKKAADPLFLAVPQGRTPREALAIANKFSFHYDTGARAVARLNLAKNYLGPWTDLDRFQDTPVSKAEIGATMLTIATSSPLSSFNSKPLASFI